ncbi:hypothetical protein QEZ54_20850 [Catellatospora sp. KI3]|uniref:hypothetical protein n=1 Tax=Catellatospora sp. KI3 TaxID=3041620 RepID=UPI00248297D5|nr:hypothetical protein [Catellatospora sp. KI3]MDI1463434.1 hypothetical protein [Catellatospora sp. KI3]
MDLLDGTDAVVSILAGIAGMIGLALTLRDRRRKRTSDGNSSQSGEPPMPDRRTLSTKARFWLTPAVGVASGFVIAGVASIVRQILESPLNPDPRDNGEIEGVAGGLLVAVVWFLFVFKRYERPPATKPASNKPSTLAGAMLNVSRAAFRWLMMRGWLRLAITPIFFIGTHFCIYSTMYGVGVLTSNPARDSVATATAAITALPLTLLWIYFAMNRIYQSRQARKAGR